MVAATLIGRAAPGDLDVNFASSNTLNSVVQAIAVQPDGRILIGGQFNSVYGQPRTGIVRLLEDGMLDPSFDAGFAPAIVHIVVQPDGKILASGSFLNFNGYQRNSIVRLKPDGKVDATFKTLYSPSPVDIRHFLLRDDGKIYVKGNFGSFGGHVTTNVALLNPDGTVDTWFTSSLHSGGITTMALAPDAMNPVSLFLGGVSFTFIPATPANFRRQIGSMDASSGAFQSSFEVPLTPITIAGGVLQLLPLPDGKLLAAGVQGYPGTNAFNGMLRFLPTGVVDTNFQAGPVPSPFQANDAAQPFQAFVRLDDGRIVAGGSFNTVQGVVRSNVVQLLANGAVDPGFATGGPNNIVSKMALQPDGKILIAGSFTQVGGIQRPFLARLHGNGAPPSILQQPVSLTVWEGEPAVFEVRAGGDPDPTITWYHGSTAVGSGKTLTLAQVAPGDAGSYHATLQNAHGTLDTATVTLTVNFGPPQITQQPQDTTVGMGATARFAPELIGTRPFLFQWFEDGLLMPGETNAVLDIHVLQTNQYGRRYYAIINTPRGSIATDEAEILPTLEGQPDKGFLLLEQSSIGGSLTAPSFRVDLRAAKTLALQPDGHVIIGGGLMTLPKPFTWTNHFAGLGVTQFSNHLVRLDAAGELALGDLATQFLDGSVNDLAVAPDGSFYAVGTFSKLGNTPRSRLIKFNSDGTLNQTFTVIILPTNAQVTCVAVHTNGRVVIGGTFTSVDGAPRTNLAQLLSTGAIDPDFVPQLATVLNGQLLDVATQADGKVLAGGSGAFLHTDIYGSRRPQLVRFNADGSWDDDFDTYGGATGNADLYSVKQIIVQPDQRILIAGVFNRFGGETNLNVARLLPDGSSDPAFQPEGECCEGSGSGVNGIALAPDGHVYVAGQFSTPQTNTTKIVRLYPDGRYDPSWFPAWVDAEPLIYPQETVAAVVVQPDLRPILAGNFIVPANHYTAPSAGKYYWENNTGFTKVGGGGGGSSSSGGAVQPGMYFLQQTDGDGTVRFHIGGLVRLFDSLAQPGTLTIYVQPKGALLTVSTNYGYVLAVAADIPNVTARLTYQWMKNGLVLPGETNSYHNIYPITMNKAGNYSVLVNAQPVNGPGQNVFSQTAQIKVLPAVNFTGLLSKQGGTFQWQLLPALGEEFTAADLVDLALLTSTNLLDWVTLSNAFTLQDGSLVITDPNAADFAQRFYKLSVNP